MKIEDILSEEELEKYHKEWEVFPQKLVLETEHHVHSGRPIIGGVHKFGEKPIFRSRIVRKGRLRKIDPYFISKKYVFPFWHIIHYWIVLEQMYHASMRLIRDTDKFRAVEMPQEFKLSKRIFWNEDISVELIWQPERQTEKYAIEDCFMTLYNDETGEVKSRFSIRTFVEKRPYVKAIEKIKEGDKKEIETLIKMVESRVISQGNLTKPRKKLLARKNYLLTKLKEGSVPEKELHDFFSFWNR